LLNGTVINDIRPAFDDCVPSTANTVSMSGLNVGDLLNQKGITWGWFQGGFALSSKRGRDRGLRIAARPVQWERFGGRLHSES
jgi:hypothetical protein